MALGITQFQPMLAGNRDVHAAQSLVEVGQCPATDQCEGAIAYAVQAPNQFQQNIIDVNRIRAIRESDQCAIDVQEVSPIGLGLRWYIVFSLRHPSAYFVKTSLRGGPDCLSASCRRMRAASNNMRPAQR